MERRPHGLILLLLACLPLWQAVHAQDSTLTVSLPTGEEVDLVWVEGGAFQMGSNTGVNPTHTYNANSPAHQVQLDGFFIGRTEVTQRLWVAVMGENPSLFTEDDSLPVEQVQFAQAQQFVTLLSQMTGHRFRLPTEAEWEYAARGGAHSLRVDYPGCSRGQLERHAWFCTNSNRTTHRVAQLMPNELGLYDMAGNVAEWCSDWFDAYSNQAQTNPMGATDGTSRVLRGGHYNSISAACSVYDRSWYVPTATSEYFGLRVVMEAD